MLRKASIILATVVVLWAVLALALGSPTLKLASGSHKRAAKSATKSATTRAVSPACLPDTLQHSAALARTGVVVSPAPGTVTANPATQISFLGASAGDIDVVSVVGARSGPHPGRLRAYSQGDGASFVPASAFARGELVTVRATIGGEGHRASVTFNFRVDSPSPTAHVPEFPNPSAQPADYETFNTLPGAQPPILSVSVADHDPAAGDILTTNGPGAGQYGPLIYTPQGQLVWFERMPAGETAEDLNEQEYEGARDLTWWRGRVLELGFGQGEDVVMNSRYQVLATLKGGNGLRADLHEFQIAPHDVAYATAFNPIRCNLAKLSGSPDGAIIDTAIQEVDMKTGLVRWEWHSLDHVGASESETPAPNTTTPWDWFHLNSIDPQSNGDLLISARNTWAAYQLQAGTGEILWRLGGTNSSFKMGHGTETAWQHDARLLPNGEITLFDDGSSPPIHHQSRAIRIALDFATRTATLSAAYTHASPLLTASQGNVQTLAEGNSVVGYGGVPQVSEYSPGGTLLLDAHLPYDMVSYRSYRYPWSATPSYPPTVLANLNSSSEQTIVHASWNGATTVASWRVLAGKSAHALAAAATMPASSFESSLILPTKVAYVSVQALDAAGRVLGSSAAVKVTSYSASQAR